MLNRGAEHAERVFFLCFCSDLDNSEGWREAAKRSGRWAQSHTAAPHHPFFLPVLQSSENSPLGNFLKGFIDVPSCHVGECPHHVPTAAAGALWDGVHPVLKLGAVS